MANEGIIVHPTREEIIESGAVPPDPEAAPVPVPVPESIPMPMPEPPQPDEAASLQDKSMEAEGPAKRYKTRAIRADEQKAE
jgi:hypothetical protein